jgi:hypothetical protein
MTIPKSLEQRRANIANQIPALGNPDINFSSVNFGRIPGTSTPRMGELGLKFSF